MVRKASTRKRQTEVADKKKLVAGVDFAPPEPIASVLPRIQLTSSQAKELSVFICRGRRRNPNNDAHAEMAKEISEELDLTNAVRQALQFYVRDVMFLSHVPQFRCRLKTLQDDVTRFVATLPQEHDPVGYFLRRTYTGEIFLKDQLRPTDEKFVELEQAWSEKHGLAAMRNSLAEFQKKYRRCEVSGIWNQANKRRRGPFCWTTRTCMGNDHGPMAEERSRRLQMWSSVWPLRRFRSSGDRAVTS